MDIEYILKKNPQIIEHKVDGEIKYIDRSYYHIFSEVIQSYENGLTQTSIPVNLLNRFCTSVFLDNKHENKTLLRYKGRCRICNLEDGIWAISRCVECDVVFYPDFVHKKFCIFYPTCWECTQLLSWDFCDIHHRINKVNREYPPLGYNKPPISNEEMDAILKEFGLDLGI